MRAAKFLFFTFFCLFGYSHADEATDEFTGDLLKVLFSEKTVQENTVVSPVSLYDVVALLQQGSNGNSETQLTKVLHAPPATTRQRYTDLVKSLKSAHRETELEFANKIYLENQFKIEDTFRSIATRDFQAGIENVEFKEPQQAADTINKWVSEETHGRITDLISPDSLDDSTAMVLLNAIFFAGNWTYQFDAYGTRDAPFTTLQKTQKTVPMMHLSEVLVAGEVEGLDAKFVRLPFRGDEFSMIFVVPNQVDGLQKVINEIQQDHLSSILAFKEKRNVDLSLPKFKFGTTSKLVPTLKKLGLTDIFSGASDLTGIARSPPLYVSDVVQKAEIEVDERGVTAAAATSVGVVATSVVILPNNKLLEIVADHPFFFLISDNDNVPLFSGWVVAP